MGEYFAYGMDLQVADGYWIQVANYTKIVVSWMSKGSRQRPTAPTYWDNHEKVFYSKDDLLNKPKRKQAMNTDARGKEQIKQIIRGSYDGQVLGLSQYGRVFHIDYREVWILHTGRELYEAVVVDDTGRMALNNVEDIRHEERLEAMNVLNDVEIGSENLRILKEYFTDPANGYNTISYTSKETGVSQEEVKAFCVALNFGMG